MRIQNYNYRYMDKHKSVYAIVLKNSPRHFGHIHFYTVPLQRVESNCIITFLDERQTEIICADIVKECGQVCEPKKMELASLVQFASSINLPTIVVVNSYCNMDEPETIHELYFAHEYQKNISNNK